MTDSSPYTHPALAGPWEATVAAVRALVARGDMPNTGAAAVYNTEDETILLRALVNPMRIDEDQAQLNLAVEASKSSVSPELMTFVVRRTMGGLTAAFCGTGTLYDFAITQLLVSLAYTSINEKHWADRLAQDPAAIARLQRAGLVPGSTIRAAHN